MKVLLLGRSGQLAWELQKIVPDSVQLKVIGSQELDISQAEQVRSAIKNFSPECVINAAAYTAVDKAESERDRAYAVNETGAANIAKSCAEVHARLLHVSTDFVFGGNKNTPLAPNDIPSPTGVYAASKLAGEKAVLQYLPHASVIVRTAWVYSVQGNNFVKTMLRLMAEKPALGIVCDQIGTPTWAHSLAQWLWSVHDKTAVTGVFHWTDAGVASWYDFAVAIQELALEKGLLKAEIPLNPIPSSAYPTPAKRPFYSVLDKTSAIAASGLSYIHWRKQLSIMLDELKKQ